jgi:hypothetical protein
METWQIVVIAVAFFFGIPFTASVWILWCLAAPGDEQ